ncbi:MAG: porin family protein [Alphaproteobacteria bacterium]|nr:porin family protein [Alphaproteobacteria bacterium]
MKKTLLLAGVAALVANTANAEIRPYIGLDGNYSSLDWAYNGESYAEDDYQSLSLVAGAKLHRNFGLEAFYQMSGNEKNRTNYGQDENLYVHTRFNAYGLDALGYLPLGCEGRVELIAGAGIAEYTFKARWLGNGSGKDHSTGYRLNAGLQYNLTDNWSLRGMYHHVYTQKSYVDAIDEYSVGIRYNF